MGGGSALPPLPVLWLYPVRRCPLWASVRLYGGVLWRWCTLYRVRGKNRSTGRIRAFYGAQGFPAVLCLWFICRCGRLCGSLWAFWGCGRVPVWVKACGGCMGLVWRSVGYALCAPLCGVLRAFCAWGVFLYPMPLFMALWAVVELWRHDARKPRRKLYRGKRKAASVGGCAALYLFIFSNSAKMANGKIRIASKIIFSPP